MVLKFLGLGKKSEYFLEAEPQSSNGSQPAAKTESVQSKPESKPAVAAESKDSAPAKVAAAAAEATATAAKATEALAAKVTQATKSTKSAKSTKSTKSQQAEPSQTDAPTEKIALPVAKVDTAPKSTTFATDHLLPLNTPRRRPGPSLAMFKDMARQVNNRK